jgi:hypothetical protein
MRKKKDTYNVLVGKPEEKRKLGRPKHRWEYNIKMCPEETGQRAWTRLMWFRIRTGGGLL